MQILPTKIEGLKLLELKVFGDDRGFFYENYHGKKYYSSGILNHFVQDNVSKSSKDVLRGLHFQNPRPQGKLISVIEGSIFDVVVDLRKNSSTFGQWESFVLSSENHRQLFVPPGFAHGFLALSEGVIINYKCSDFYAPESEYSLLWNDSDIKIEWPVKNPLISPKDSRGIRFKEIPENLLF